ncbi:MAG: hypothetical protein ACYS3S_00265 [Planctomycetota bacterium]|jgi:hypothetical protein
MKKLIISMVFSLFSLALIMSAQVCAAPKGAGSGYVNPNTFDSYGMLSIVANPGQAPGTPMELWMGVGNENAGMLIGYVTFYYVGTQGYVKIDLSDFDGEPGPDMFPFVATKIHIHFAPSVNEIPHTSKGNPILGLFEYNIPVTDPYQTIYDIPVEFDVVGAIHLSVYRYGGIEGFNFWLPNDQVTLRIVDYPSAGDPSYFKLKITNGGFISEYDMGYGSGIYEGWCVDVDHTIGLNVNYPAYLYSSYETLPSWVVGPGKLEYPENLDLVNYLVNTFEVGQLVQPMNADCTPRINPGTGQPYPPEPLTYGDIQRAIWSYVDNNQSTSGLGPWSQYRVNAILCEVDANGEGFIPTCEDKVVFIVIPTGTPGSFSYQLVIGQPVIGTIAVECTSAGGTAWGDGKYGANFPGARQWGTYFYVDLY